MKSIKQHQSEMGAVGEPGPNYELMKNMEPLLDSFEHEHDTDSEDDAFIFIANIRLGHEYKNEKESVLGFSLHAKGCPEDLEDLFFNLFAKDKMMFSLAAKALQRANTFRIKQTLRKFFEEEDEDEF